jgi:hypothetical protein
MHKSTGRQVFLPSSFFLLPSFSAANAGAFFSRQAMKSEG